MAARSRKSREASLVRADGVVWSGNFFTTPPRPLHLEVASLLLLDVAASPPPAEEGSRLRQLSKRSAICPARHFAAARFSSSRASLISSSFAPASASLPSDVSLR